MWRNIFRRHMACSEAGGWLFKTLLQNKVKLIWTGKADSKLLTDSAFVGEKAPVTTAVLMDTIEKFFGFRP
jgi:hypothetical protein